MSEATREADRRAAENLLACYCREVASPAGEARWTGAADLVITLRATRREIRVTTIRSSLVGGFEIAGPPRVDGAEVDAPALARVLIAEAGAREGRAPHPELEGLIRNSRAVAEHLLAHRPEATAPGFLGSEQSLTHGHPFHPSPKAREGFDAADLSRYSPELGAGFPLHFFAVSPDLVEEEAVGPRPCGALVEETVGGRFGAPAGFAILPAHPWQARNVLESGILEGFFHTGEVVDLGAAGPAWFPTSSVRTLYRPGAPCFLKASLGVRITNCIRRNAAHELRCAVQVTRWMREERPRLAALFPRFTALDEIAWRALFPHEGDLGVRNYLGELFGFLLRDAEPVAAPTPDAEPRVAAALFGDRDAGRARLGALLPRARREAWLHGYCEALVSPMLFLFFEAGLMFEPHLQNVLVGGFDGDAPTVLLRDYDNCKVVEGLFDPARLDGLLPEVTAELCYPADLSWERFVYCLFVNNLAEVATMLADGAPAEEVRLWGVIRDHLAAWLARHGTTRSQGRVEALLRRESLPAKANLLTRIFKQKDRLAPFAFVPNPLAR